MDELVAWLREQVAADREVAVRNSEGKGLANGYPDYQTNVDDDTRAADAHIERFGARRVLAQCDAYEAILDAHPLVGDTHDDMHDPKCGVCVAPGGIGCGEYPEDWKTQSWPSPTVRAVTLAYQHCVGYRDEWRPVSP